MSVIQDVYEAPKLRELGSVEEWTKGAPNGVFTDKDFPVHTPAQDLTFTLVP